MSILKDGHTLTRMPAGDPGRGRVLTGSSTGTEMQFEGLLSFAKALMSPF